MCNCNQQRQTYASGTGHRPGAMVRVMLMKNTPLTVNGDLTGRLYFFRKKEEVIWVDKRDAATLGSHPALKILY